MQWQSILTAPKHKRLNISPDAATYNDSFEYFLFVLWLFYTLNIWQDKMEQINAEVICRSVIKKTKRICEHLTGKAVKYSIEGGDRRNDIANKKKTNKAKNID